MSVLIPGLLQRSGMRSVHSARRRRGGFSIVELLVVIGILVILLGILIPVIVKANEAAQSAACLANLRKIGEAFNMYALANHNKMPDPLRGELSWEKTLGNYLDTAAVLRCRADQEIFPFIGSSYDWRDTGDPETTLAGQTTQGVRPSAVLAFEALPSWHAQGKMNAVRFDLTAETMDVQDCLGDIQRPVRADAK